jgi:hypothetical protein
MYKKTLNILIVSVITLLVSILLYTLLFLTIGQSREKLINLESTLEQVVLEEQQYLSQKILLKDTQEDRVELDSYFLTEAGIATFLEEIEMLGEDANVLVNIDSVDVRGSEDEEISDVLDVALDVSGNWVSLFHYLSLMESLPLALTVEKSAMSISGSGEEGSVDWKGSFDITVAILK